MNRHKISRTATFRNLLLIGLLAGVAHAPLHAQEAPAGDETAAEPDPEVFEPDPYDDVVVEEGGEEIVVTGTRLRGAVEGDIPPEHTLDARDIRAYGAGNLSELLDALAPQTQSGRGREGGRPVVLLNGRRISGFSEIRDIPPEAIERVDILPEEVALKYGYRADQRVVNFVLRPRFRAITAELEGGLATAGGRGSYEADVNILRITNDGRWSADIEYERETPLYESERDLIQSPVEDPYDLLGNVGAIPLGGEIDTALSALAGETVTIAGVPLSAGDGPPPLSAFVPGANAANRTGLGPYRTLLAGSEQLSANGTLNRTMFGDVSATVNARFEAGRNQSSFGLPSAALLIPEGNPFSPFGSDVTLYRYFNGPGALTRESDTRSGHLGLALSGDLSDWRWSFTSNYDRGSSISRTDRGVDLADLQARIDAGDPSLNPFAPVSGDLLAERPRDRAKSLTQTANAELVMSGPIVAVPAGEIRATARAGADTRGIRSESLRSGIEQEREVARHRANFQGNVDIPIASRRDDVLAAIGDLSANANFEVQELSDFGTLTTLGGGINWSPVKEVRLIASITDEDGAPSVQQLGDPVVLTPGVRVFDFLRGETVDITRIEGGNPDLLADSRRVMKLGLTVRPWEDKELSLRADYVRTRTRDLIASFPTATAEIEAAFPDRFTRDADGRLLSIDSRPVNFARADSEELRWGINFSKPIGSSAPQERRGAGAGRRAPAQEGEGQAPAQGQAPNRSEAPVRLEGQGETPAQPRQEAASGQEGRGPRAGGGMRFGGRGFGGPGGQQGGRLQLSLYHNWRLQDEILIRDGVPELDFLNGSAAGNRGGRPRHEIQARAGIFKDGFGARLSADWQSGTVVRGDAGAGTGDGDLFFSDLATFNLRLFADLGQQRSLVRDNRWMRGMRGMRVSLSVDNIFDSRMRVWDETGATPISYQPYYLDPLGRTVRISVRKLFF